MDKVTRHYDRPPISRIYEKLPGFGVDLFIGGREGASDLNLLRENGISTVLNTAVNLDFNYVPASDAVSHDGGASYGPAPIRYYKLGIVDGPGNPDTLFLAGYYQLLGVLAQVIPDRSSYPVRDRGNLLVNCRAGRSRSVVLAALLLHLQIPAEFPTLAAAIDHVREKRQLRPDEWHETPKPMLIAAAERVADWVRLVEAQKVRAAEPVRAVE